MARERTLSVLVLLLAATIGTWIWYAVTMHQYPLASAYPLQALHGQLALFGILFAVLYAALTVYVAVTREEYFWRRTRHILLMALTASILIGCIALSIPPTRSPDLYWTLLAGKGWVAQGVNPYMGVSDDFVKAHPWGAKAGFVQSVVYGPLWTYLVAGAAWATDSLALALALMKTVGLTALIAGVVAVRKLMEAYGVTRERRTQLTVLLLVNPMLLQAGLVDVSNDIITFAAIAWAMVLTSRGRHLLSVALLLVGGLIKYVPWLFIPIPLAQMAIEHRRPRMRETGVALAAGIAVVLAYFPFGKAALLGEGMRRVFEWYGFGFTSFPGAWLLGRAGIPFIGLWIAGAGIALSGAAFFAIRRKWQVAWLWVPAVLTMFASGWVNPWYLLWLIPGAAAAGSIGLVSAVGVAGILMPWVFHPIHVGSALVMLGGLVWWLRSAGGRYGAWLRDIV